MFLIAVFMTAGCAKQEVVKRDEGVVPVAVANKVEPLESNESKANVTPSEQAVTAPVMQVTSPASSQQSQKISSTAELQSALEKVYFNFDSADLSESARSTLTDNAAALAKETTAKIRIEGNCDERGSTEYNLALGERRAKAAQQYLVTIGVKSNRLSIVSYGKEKPAVQGDNEAAWTKNRRDEFIVATR
jgi:peptidoglycan-associated lipoprotein